MKKLSDFFHHLFIPNENNNFRAKVLHHDFLSLFLILAFFSAILFKHSFLSEILGFATDITVEKLYQLTNQERIKYNLLPLKYSERLSQAAYKKAQDMFAKNYWAHYGPDGTTPWEFILSTGYKYEYAGENLAKNFLFSDGVISAWMNSPSHRDNILRKEYTEVGFAVVNGILNGEETTLVVQIFGKPLSSSLVKKVTAQEQIEEINEDKNLNQNIQKDNFKPEKSVLAKNTFKNKKINITSTIFSFNFIFLVFLIFALILDFYFANKLGIVRLTGKNIFHFIFVIFLLISLLIIRKGAIL